MNTNANPYTSSHRDLIGDVKRYPSRATPQGYTPIQKPLFANHAPGIRQVKLDSNYEVCPVFSVRRSNSDGDPNYQTTYQAPLDGNMVLRKQVGCSIQGFHLNEHKDPYAHLDHDQLAIAIARTPIKVIEWLLDIERMQHTNFLPVGCGWDGVYSQTEILKQNKIRRFLSPRYDGVADYDPDGEWMNDIVFETGRTSKSLINLDWNTATILDEDNPIPVDQDHEQWFIVVYKDNNRSKIEKPKKLIGAVDRYPGLRLDDLSKVFGIIVLTKGIVTNERGVRYGCSVDLLRINHFD